MSTAAVGQALALAEDGRGEALLTIPEGQWFERKSARIQARDLANTLIGLANAEGGTVIVGLSEGVVEGVDGAGSRRLSEWQKAQIDFTEPPVRCKSELVGCLNRTGARDNLLVCEVEVSEQVHANRKDEVFLRVGDENRKLPFALRQDLIFDKGQATFEIRAIGEADFGDLDEELLASYAATLKHPEPRRLLQARGILTGRHELSIAAVLLFCKHPQTWLPETYVRVLRYRGTVRGAGSRQQLIEDIRLEGPIPKMLQEARQILLELIPSRRALDNGGRFVEIPLIPEEAWLEGLVNAVVHRSYNMIGDHVRVEIFDDRVEIASPGRFPGVADPSDPMQINRFARNPRIARVCSDLGFGQELGEGIRRIVEEMRSAGLSDPEYVQTAGSVRLKLSSAVIDRELLDRLPSLSRELLRQIRQADRLSTGDLVGMTGFSRPAVLRRLRELEAQGLIEWVGKGRSDPRAFWRMRRL